MRARADYPASSLTTASLQLEIYSQSHQRWLGASGVVGQGRVSAFLRRSSRLPIADSKTPLPISTPHLSPSASRLCESNRVVTSISTKRPPPRDGLSVPRTGFQFSASR